MWRRAVFAGGLDLVSCIFHACSMLPCFHPITNLLSRCTLPDLAQPTGHPSIPVSSQTQTPSLSDPPSVSSITFGLCVLHPWTSKSNWPWLAGPGSPATVLTLLGITGLHPLTSRIRVSFTTRAAKVKLKPSRSLRLDVQRPTSNAQSYCGAQLSFPIFSSRARPHVGQVSSSARQSLDSPVPLTSHVTSHVLTD